MRQLPQPFWKHCSMRIWVLLEAIHFCQTHIVMRSACLWTPTHPTPVAVSVRCFCCVRLRGTATSIQVKSVASQMMRVQAEVHSRFSSSTLLILILVPSSPNTSILGCEARARTLEHTSEVWKTTRLPKKTSTGGLIASIDWWYAMVLWACWPRPTISAISLQQSCDMARHMLQWCGKLRPWQFSFVKQWPGWMPMSKRLAFWVPRLRNRSARHLMCSDVSHTDTGLQKTSFVLKSPEAVPGDSFLGHFVQFAAGWRPAKYSTIEINRLLHSQ